MNTHSRGYVACTLWALAVAMMVFGSMDYGRRGDVTLLSWGLFLAFPATCVTVWLIVGVAALERQVTVERVAEMVYNLHDIDEGSRVSRMR